MKTILSILFLPTLSLFAQSVQDTLYVPNDYPTIMSALSVANEGDLVLVEPGVYNENLWWPETNGIKLVSSGDSSNTIIDGGGQGSVVYMNPQTVDIDTTTLISGFTITNGGETQKGGGLMYMTVMGILLNI